MNSEELKGAINSNSICLENLLYSSIISRKVDDIDFGCVKIQFYWFLTFLQRLSSWVYPLFMHCHNTTWVEIVLKRLPNQLFFLLHFAFCMMPSLTSAIYLQHSQFKSYQILFIVNTLSFLVQTVDIGSVDLVECIILKSVFSPKRHGKECSLTSR